MSSTKTVHGRCGLCGTHSRKRPMRHTYSFVLGYYRLECENPFDCLVSRKKEAKNAK